MTQHYCILTWGRGSHRHSWFWHSPGLSLNHPHLCTEAVQLYLAQLPPGRATNRQRPSYNWEGFSALALVYTLHLCKNHCCTSLRDSCVGQSRTPRGRSSKPFAELLWWYKPGDHRRFLTKKNRGKTFSKHKSLFCPLPPRLSFSL